MLLAGADHPAVGQSIRAGTTGQLATLMGNRHLGMQTLDGALAELVVGGHVAPDVARATSANVQAFDTALDATRRRTMAYATRR